MSRASTIDEQQNTGAGGIWGAFPELPPKCPDIFEIAEAISEAGLELEFHGAVQAFSQAFFVDFDEPQAGPCADFQVPLDRFQIDVSTLFHDEDPRRCLNRQPCVYQVTLELNGEGSRSAPRYGRDGVVVPVTHQL